ncbi:NotI family restriction endonuclease [Ruegeria atlantica]|uniref:NotI family restriction endonuclease n=1 Tax=Ruegeria atlantica TaxID=81569 RepID=UPI00147B45E7|nr:NotI family restriction endonuclease [Ruegeria atlantica]
MRANSNDIVEFFGHSPDDMSVSAVTSFNQKSCPFVGGGCTKINHENKTVYGVCSVTGALDGKTRDEVVICPKRLYAEGYGILKKVTEVVWGDLPLVVGGGQKTLSAKASKHKECVVAFGQNSVREVTVKSFSRLSMDWVLQRYRMNGLFLEAIDYVGVEVQSIDITNNYRDPFQAYSALKMGVSVTDIPDSEHGLNWANVHKRLIPQIIRKGNVYTHAERCVGFFFVVPDQVYKKFEEILGELPEQQSPNRKNLSVLTYILGDPVPSGEIRQLSNVRERHHSLEDIALAFCTNSHPDASKNLEQNLKKML